VASQAGGVLLQTVLHLHDASSSSHSVRGSQHSAPAAALHTTIARWPFVKRVLMNCPLGTSLWRPSEEWETGNHRQIAARQHRKRLNQRAQELRQQNGKLLYGVHAQMKAGIFRVSLFMVLCCLSFDNATSESNNAKSIIQ